VSILHFQLCMLALSIQQFYVHRGKSGRADSDDVGDADGVGRRLGRSSTRTRAGPRGGTARPGALSSRKFVPGRGKHEDGKKSVKPKKPPNLKKTNRLDLTKDTNAEPKVREAQRSAAKNVSTPNKVEGSESVIDEDSRDKDIMELKEQMQTLQKQNQMLQTQLADQMAHSKRRKLDDVPVQMDMDMDRIPPTSLRNVLRQNISYTSQLEKKNNFLTLALLEQQRNQDKDEANSRLRNAQLLTQMFLMH